jgi:hypothetical protein
MAGLAAAAFLGGAAMAQPGSLRDQLFGRDERGFSTPPVARFQPDDGAPFVLDRSPGRQVFMKFESSPEIWALEPTPGPRGDIIYKNDMGQPMLRSTRLGGLTLFTPERPDGVAAAFAGDAGYLRPPLVITPGALLQIFAQASGRASRAARHAIAFEAEDVPLGAIGVIADAAMVTAEAVVDVANRGERARKQLEKLAKVRIATGKRAQVAYSNGAVTVYVDPDRGVGGRPSSLRVAAAISKR